MIYRISVFEISKGIKTKSRSVRKLTRMQVVDSPNSIRFGSWVAFQKSRLRFAI